jgi:hypothetical protein
VALSYGFLDGCPCGRVGLVDGSAAAELVAEDQIPHDGFKESGYEKDLSTCSPEDCEVVKHVMSSLAQCHSGSRSQGLTSADLRV